MAQELVLTGTFTFNKPPATGLDKSFNFTVDVTGTSLVFHVQNIGTANETLVLGDVAVPGYCFFHNMDIAGNSVLLSNASLAGVVAPIKIKPGEWAMFRWGDTGATTMNAKATPAAANLEYAVVPD